MQDKTAPIPSLKEWEGRRQERSAQAERTGSMQTKGQMKRSADRQRSSAQSANSAGRTSSKRKPQVGTPERKGSAERAQRPTGAQRAPQNPPRRNSSANNQGERRRSAAAPEVYARERNFADYDSSRRVDRESQQRKRENTSRQGGGGRPADSSRVDSQRRTSSQGRVTETRRPSGSSGRKTSRGNVPPKPPRKPLSPAARKFRSIVVSILIVLGVVLVGAVLSLTVLFKTETINVKGSGSYSKQQIIEASGLVYGDNIFTSPKARAEKKIEKKFPYVEDADIYSVFPNSINIDITLADPAYIIEGLGGFYIVSDKGKVLEVASSDDEAGIPVIEGVTVEGKPAGEFIEFDSELIGTALQELFASFKSMGTTNITAINIAADGETFSMKYVYDDRIVVYIGLPEHIDYKVQTAHTVIKEKIDVGGSMIAGDLDVSMCYDTMKSYFNQYTLLSPHVTATEPATEEEQVETQMVYY